MVSVNHRYHVFQCHLLHVGKMGQVIFTDHNSVLGSMSVYINRNCQCLFYDLHGGFGLNLTNLTYILQQRRTCQKMSES